VRVLAALLALAAICCMMGAIVGMVTGRPGDRAGTWLRVAAVVLFGAAVAINVAAHA
jgi:hypothetical protein